MNLRFERIIRFEPAFDNRDADPEKNYGIHGVTLRMVLKSSKGATEFVLYTNWHLPHVQNELDRCIDSKFPHLTCHPQPAHLGYHSKTPHYEGQEPIGAVRCDFSKTETEKVGDAELPKLNRIETGTFDPCAFVDGGPCYYDGSSLEAKKVYNRLLEKGSEAVWEFLEAEYRRIFETPKTKESNCIRLFNAVIDFLKGYYRFKQKRKADAQSAKESKSR